MKKFQVSLWIGVFLLILTSCGVPRATPTQAANSVVISTFTAAPVNSATPSTVLTATLLSTPNLEVVGQLPGLSPVNITVSLEGQEFTCTQVKKVADHYERTCLKGLRSESLFQVVIAGREPFLVDFIEASVLQAKEPDNDIAAPLLGFMATMPYDGATPEDARAWVESTISTWSGQPDDAKETMFGPVKYVLSGLPKALVLEMGELPK
jgi:hypothetical protein